MFIRHTELRGRGSHKLIKRAPRIVWNPDSSALWLADKRRECGEWRTRIERSDKTSTGGQEFWSGPPVRLFATPTGFPLTNVVGQRADVSPDGERFVFLLAPRK
jgi:hypothetical protein